MFPLDQKHKPRWRITAIVLAIFLAVIASGAFVAWQVYEQNLEPVSTSEQNQRFTIPAGASARDIATSLQKAGLIRAAWAFEWYVRKEGAREYLQAGSYDLRPNMSIPEIVSVLTKGKIATDLVTILPGKTLDEIRQALITEYGFDTAAVDAALNPDAYSGHPALADKPPGASLEGFLYPESFHKTIETTPEDIIRSSLDQMNKHLTPGIKKAITTQGLSVYQGIVLASLVEKEVSNAEDRKMVAQVFLRRLREDIALESNTSDYTYDHKGLPPVPISNVSSSSLAAVAQPATTDFLYFVSGDDGRTHFSHTLEQHEASVRQHCTELCQ